MCNNRAGRKYACPGNRFVQTDYAELSLNMEVYMRNRIETPSAGEILREEFLKPMGISAYRLAADIGVPVSRIQDILHGRRKITADTSLRLGVYFGVSDLYFLNLQNNIDIRNERIRLEEELNRIIPVSVSPSGS